MARRTDKDKEKIKTTREVINQAKVNSLNAKESLKENLNELKEAKKLSESDKGVKRKHKRREFCNQKG